MAKIPYKEWAEKNNLPPYVAQQLLRRRFKKDGALEGMTQKKRIYIETWFIEEDVKIEKSTSGKWIIYRQSNPST